MRVTTFKFRFVTMARCLTVLEIGEISTAVGRLTVQLIKEEVAPWQTIKNIQDTTTQAVGASVAPQELERQLRQGR